MGGGQEGVEDELAQGGTTYPEGLGGGGIESELRDAGAAASKGVESLAVAGVESRSIP